jgi:hypothetical protein
MILADDLHIRLTTPRARTDNFFEAQEKKLRFLLQQAQDGDGILLVAGDFFHIPKPGEGLLRWVIDLMKEFSSVHVILTPGQHDLPMHNLEQISSSGIGVLESAGVILILTKTRDPIAFGEWVIWGCAYGEEPDKSMVDTTRKNLLLWHKMIIQEPLWPGQIADKAPTILRKYPNYQVICSGDNHQSFYVMNGGKRFLVNPGSITRQTAAQVDHRPHVFKWENDILTPIPIPIELGVLDLSELAQEKERDSRISAFVERLSTNHEIGLSFEKNMEEFIRVNKVDPDVVKLIWRVMEK